jgi:sugar phosphate isomerase/epimerase
MQLGISSWTFTWAVGIAGHRPERPLQPVDLLDRAAKLGVRVVQICDNLPLADLTAGELTALERWSSRLGVAIEVGTRGIDRINLLTHLALAQRFGSSIVRVVIDTATHHPGEDEVVRTLRRVRREFERAHVCLAIENHDRFQARTLARMVERIGSQYVGICLDTGNSFGSLEGPEVVVEILAPLTVNLHVKDYLVQRAGHNLGFVIEGRPAGQGQLNIAQVLQTVREQGRDPNAILEQWTPPESTLAATIAKEEDWAVQSVTYLRQLIPD